MWHLKTSPWLSQLTADQCTLLERSARKRSFAKGCAIYLPGTQSQDVLLVAEGRVRISSLTPQGKQAVLAYVEPGELFGEQALFEQVDREELAEAVEKSLVIWLAGDDLMRVMEQSPRLSLAITRMIGLRRRRIERRLKSLLFRSNRDRLVQLLLDLADQYGRRTRDGWQITLKLSHHDLAGLIGSTRESVSVLLGELRNEGSVSLGRRSVTLRNPDWLRASLNAPCHLTSGMSAGGGNSS